MTDTDSRNDLEHSPLQSDSRPTAGHDPEDAHFNVERVLQTIPESRIDARRSITRELGFEPSPEELQAVVRLAYESPPGVAREMSRGALELRVRAEQQVAQVMDKPLQGAGIQRAARSVADLLFEVNGFADALRAASGALGNVEGCFLTEVGETLLPSRNDLTTASVLAPRLSLLAECENASELRVSIPSLTEEDAALISRLLHGSDALGSGTSRISINALAMKTIMLDDLATWEGLSEDDAIESRESVVRRLHEDKIAYLTLAQQLQVRQDMALLAGLQDLSSELRTSKRDLFAVYTQLATVLNESAQSNPTAESGPPVSIDDLEQLLADCRASDAIAHAQRSVRQTTEELFLDALKRDNVKIRKQTDQTPRARARTLQRERKRLRVLGAIAATMFLGCVGVYVNRAARSHKNELSFPATELNGSMIVSKALAIGSMMYAETSRFVWDDMETSERATRMEALGIQAQSHGFTSVCLSDENHIELALWSAGAGIKIHALDYGGAR